MTAQISDYLDACEDILDLDDRAPTFLLQASPTEETDEPRTVVVSLPVPLRNDSLPEYARYQDTGCDLAPSCLSCPFTTCRYDDFLDGKSHRVKEGQSRFAELREQGLSIKAIAGTMGISLRTAFRYNAEVYGAGFKPKLTTTVVRPPATAPRDTAALRAALEDARRILRVLRAFQS